MNWGTFSRSVIIGMLLVAAVGFGQPAHAQTAASSTGDCPYWIDELTGEHVPTGPYGWTPLGGHDPVTSPNGRHFVYVPCPPPTPPPTPPAPPPPPTPPVRTATYSGLGINPPPAFQVGSANFRSALVTVDYANFSPSAGANENQYGFSTGILTNPFSGDTGGTNPMILNDNLSPADVFPAQGGGIAAPALELTAAYHHATSTGFNTDLWNTGGSLVWFAPQWRFGPAFGYQSSSTSGFSSHTWNYGGFAEWFACDSVTAFAKGGGFSGNGTSDGFYLGGSGKWYATPDFAFNGGIDYTRWTSFGGSDELDYTIGGEYLFSETTPVSLFAGYTRSDYSGSYHVDTVFVGLRFYVNGEGVTALVDRQRTGEPAPHQFKF